MACFVTHPKLLQSVSIVLPDQTRRMVLGGGLALLYALSAGWCYSTSGQLYEEGLKKAKAVEWEHYVNGTDPKDVPLQPPLPSPLSPSTWAGVALFCAASLHALFHLMCYWKVWFEAAAVYRPAPAVGAGCWAQVTPQRHRGKAALVPLVRSKRTQRLCFEFQRQTYEYLAPEELLADGAAAGELRGGAAAAARGGVRLIRCPVDRPLPEYLGAAGIADAEEEAALLEHFGPNQLSIPTPTFLKCYKQQLLTPLVIFQLFVALLWLMDDYWQYTAFQILTVLMLESVSVFQRLKTLKTLNGMSTKPFFVKVYRRGRWAEKSTRDLLPGDLIQLSVITWTEERWRASRPPAAPAPTAAEVAMARAAGMASAVNVVPCDCVVIRGNAVVNEATLTGESIPQMKDALPSAARPLVLEGEDRMHALFSGSTLISATNRSDNRAASASNVQPPDDGCLCYVLRTGFNSSQGELIQMIEFSVDKVSADSKEIMWALLILVCFALTAAGYVLKKGMDKGDKTTSELLLKCVIIITSVVPRQLPLQMAMAVNQALMALMKSGVYCSEPYRVPFGGKITHCLFDKTGTLTTDTLVPVAVVPAAGEHASEQMAVHQASPEAAMVLSACQSLVSLEGVGLVGDPIEVAALRGVGWRFDADSETAEPGNWEAHEKVIASLEKDLAGSSPAAGKQAELDSARLRLAQAQQRTRESPVQAVQIIHRFHFGSELQRMSTVVKVRSDGAQIPAGRYALVKGSPEILKTLLRAQAQPAWYDETYRSMAERGMRVLGLAYKRLPDDQSAIPSREEVESGLEFAGFISFSCKTRADSAIVLGALRESDHGVAMVTGDALLTALHVARETGICRNRIALTLAAGPTRLEWVVATGRDPECIPFRAAEMSRLAAQYDLMVTDSTLLAAAEQDPAVWQHMAAIQVFARMKPQGKAKVIRSLQQHGGNFVLMCGDGGNDVGALKQADIGLALLSGYGNINTTGEEDEAESIEGGGRDSYTGAESTAEVQLNEQQKALVKRAGEAQKQKQLLLKQKQEQLAAKQQQWMQEEIAAREARGEGTGFMGHAAAIKAVTLRMKADMDQEANVLNSKFGNVFDKKKSDPLAASMDAMESDAPGGMPVVRPGDASVAAPFTSRAPSVKNCVDLIRQGRCTLLSALQQQQIMMLECIISSYVLSAISLEGSRSSERQMMASSWLLMTASLAFSYAKPIDRMHRIRPIRSLFHPAVFISMLGQAVIHLACMVYAVELAKSTMAADSPERKSGWSGPTLEDVSKFHKEQKLIRRGLLEKEEDPDAEMDWVAESMEMWTTPFLPNLMNTVVFLVETSQIIAIMFVNYKGQPWMKGVLENHPLFLSVFICIAGIAACAWEVRPEFNALIHLSPFPNDTFRWQVMTMVGLTLVGTFIWDRLVTALFAWDIFSAQLKIASKTTPLDLLPIAKTVVKVAGGLMLFSSGNIFLCGGAFWLYRKIPAEP